MYTYTIVHLSSRMIWNDFFSSEAGRRGRRKKILKMSWQHLGSTNVFSLRYMVRTGGCDGVQVPIKTVPMFCESSFDQPVCLISLIWPAFVHAMHFPTVCILNIPFWQDLQKSYSKISRWIYHISGACTDERHVSDMIIKRDLEMKIWILNIT